MPSSLIRKTYGLYERSSRRIPYLWLLSLNFAKRFISQVVRERRKKKWWLYLVGMIFLLWTHTNVMRVLRTQRDKARYLIAQVFLSSRNLSISLQLYTLKYKVQSYNEQTSDLNSFLTSLLASNDVWSVNNGINIVRVVYGWNISIITLVFSLSLFRLTECWCKEITSKKENNERRKKKLSYRSYPPQRRQRQISTRGLLAFITRKRAVTIIHFALCIRCLTYI